MGTPYYRNQEEVSIRDDEADDSTALADVDAIPGLDGYTYAGLFSMMIDAGWTIMTRSRASADAAQRTSLD